MTTNQVMVAAHHVLPVRQCERQFTVLQPTLSDSARNGSFVPIQERGGLADAGFAGTGALVEAAGPAAPIPPLGALTLSGRAGAFGMRFR